MTTPGPGPQPAQLAQLATRVVVGGRTRIDLVSGRPVPGATRRGEKRRRVPVTAGPAATLTPNTSRNVKFGSSPALVVRTKTGELRAFAGTCTHLSCTVQYREDLEHIWCACHNGHYDLFGKNLSGPPPRPLEAYDADVQGDEIVISRRT